MTPDDVVARAKELVGQRVHLTGGRSAAAQGGRRMTTMPVEPPVLAADASGRIAAGGSMSTAQSRTQRAREAKAASDALRRVATAERMATIAARTAPTGYRIGTWVRTNTPRSRRFHNRIGVVVTNNLGEVGVGFGTDWAVKLPDLEAWFLPTELERVR